MNVRLSVAAPVKVSALEEVLVRVAAMADAHAEIADVDINPVIVHRDGAVIVDARIRIEAPAAKEAALAR